MWAPLITFIDKVSPWSRRAGSPLFSPRGRFVTLWLLIFSSVQKIIRRIIRIIINTLHIERTELGPPRRCPELLPLLVLKNQETVPMLLCLRASMMWLLVCRGDKDTPTHSNTGTWLNAQMSNAQMRWGCSTFLPEECTSAGLGKMWGNEAKDNKKHSEKCTWCITGRRKLIKVQHKSSPPPPIPCRISSPAVLICAAAWSCTFSVI